MQLLKNKLKTVCVCLFSFGLSACQSFPNKADNNNSAWQSDQPFFVQRYNQLAAVKDRKLNAKVSVKTPKSTDQASLVWKVENNSNNKISIYGPLGVGAVKLNFDDNGAQLKDNKGKLYKMASPEQLLTEIVGWPIPVKALNYWLFATPLPGVGFHYQTNKQGDLTALNQLGWHIEYLSMQKYGTLTLPRKIVATTTQNNQEIRVKLIVKSWVWQ